MGQAKEIKVVPISKRDADIICKKLHYSGKVAPNSQLHFGVLYHGQIHGVMQFGPSIVKSKMVGLVKDTKWNGFIELNRMAFDDFLPPNSESRALGAAFRIIKRNYPHIEWVVSFSDATQCGDGAIYRASGFVLTQISKNSSMYKMPDGEIVCSITFNKGGDSPIRRRYGMLPTETFGMFQKRIGATCLEGYQLRYIKFINPADVTRLVGPVLPFSSIKALGASMYRGAKPSVEATDSQREEGQP